jgi:hypothetical protein
MDKVVKYLKFAEVYGLYYESAPEDPFSVAYLYKGNDEDEFAVVVRLNDEKSFNYCEVFKRNNKDSWDIDNKDDFEFISTLRFKKDIFLPLHPVDIAECLGLDKNFKDFIKPNLEKEKDLWKF